MLGCVVVVHEHIDEVEACFHFLFAELLLELDVHDARSHVTAVAHASSEEDQEEAIY